MDLVQSRALKRRERAGLTASARGSILGAFFE